MNKSGMISNDAKPAQPSKTSQQSHQQKKKVVKLRSHVAREAISSNWKRMQAAKILTATDVMNHKFSLDNSPSAFGSNESLGISSSGMVLSSTQSSLSLFPAPSTGLSEAKLAQPSKFVALDCEMVGGGAGGLQSILARVSLVNYHGRVLLDVYVKPSVRISDFRSEVSGITPAHVTESKVTPGENVLGHRLLSLEAVRALVVDLFKDRTVVGHALNNDFSALLLSSHHPRRMQRDTAKYRPFLELAEGEAPSLKLLASRILRVGIQQEAHDSVEDARIAMLLYRRVKKDWENLIFRGSNAKSKAPESK